MKGEQLVLEPSWPMLLRKHANPVQVPIDVTNHREVAWSLIESAEKRRRTLEASR